MELKFGHGELVVYTGWFGGLPAVFIAPATEPGLVGTSAEPGNHDFGYLLNSEHVLTFPSEKQAEAVADALVSGRR